MFGSNKNEANKSKGSAIAPSFSSSSSGSHSLNSLVGGTTVEGTVHSESDIRVDGTIKGTLICKAKVIIGPSGFVQGEIRCENSVIEGKFEGDIFVSQLLNIRENAHIKGKVQTNKLIVQSGAAFNVTCQMGKVQQTPVSSPVDKNSGDVVKKENLKATTTKAPSVS